MKKFLFIAFLISFTAVKGQDILIMDSVGTIWNGDTIEMEKHMTTQDAADTTFMIKFQEAFIKNNSNGVVSVKVKRVVGTAQTGINDQMCWGGICEQEIFPFDDERTSTFYFNMQPQDVIAGGGSGFAGYYMPRGAYGPSYFTYTFYDMNLSASPAVFTVKFNAIKSVGIKERPAQSKFNVKPNPASDYIEMSNLPSSQSEIEVEILNIIGKVVAEKMIDPSEGKERIGISHLQSGIYFVRIKTDQKYSETQKLIVR